MASEVWGDDASGAYVWTAGNVREAIPDVMTPCTWSVVQPYIEQSAGPRIQAGHPLFAAIAGRLYMNLSVSVTAAERMGAAWLFEEMSRQAFGPVPDELDVTPIPMSRTAVMRTLGWHQVRVRVWTLANTMRFDRMLRRLRDDCDRLLDVIPTVDTERDLLTLWRRQIEPVFVRACKLVRFSAPAWMAMAGHHRILSALVGEASAAVVTAGSSRRGHLASLDLVVGIDRLRAGTIDPTTFARRYGHRGPHEHELSEPRPGEDPGWIGQQRRAADAAEAETLLRRQRASREAAWQDIRRASRVRHALARWHARAWGRAARRRERTRAETTRVFWVIRAFVERAGQLTGHGDDLYMLTIDEIARVLAGDDAPLAGIEHRRSVYCRQRSMPEPPVVFRGPIDTCAPTWSDGTVDPGDRELTGQPGASGVATGTARVALDFDDAAALRPGEILVTRVTNVGWTPLFATAGAIVTDVGAVLSHAAIVARELGVPAVVGTQIATTRIRTGDALRVDGGAGTVTILSRDAGPEASATGSA